MLGFIKKSLLWIASGTVSVILTACYGVNSMAECFSKKVTIIDSEGNPIKGLDVTLYTDYYSDPYTERTDDAGVVEMIFCSENSKVTVEVFDVDEDENGEFKEKTVIFSADDNPETIVMESVE